MAIHIVHNSTHTCHVRHRGERNVAFDRATPQSTAIGISMHRRAKPFPPFYTKHFTGEREIECKLVIVVCVCVFLPMSQ